MKTLVQFIVFALLLTSAEAAQIERRMFRGNSVTSQLLACNQATEEANRWVSTPQGTARGFKKQNSNSVGQCTCESTKDALGERWYCTLNAVIDWQDPQ